MQLRTARLCLDCEEVHDSQHCPVCASEAFSYLSRWVPAPERRRRPRSANSAEAEVYRRLTDRLTAPPERPKWQRVLGQSAMGLAVAGVVGWLMSRTGDDTRSSKAA